MKRDPPDETKPKLSKFEWLTLILSIIAIVVSLGGVIVNQWMANNAAQEQQKLSQQSMIKAIDLEVAILQFRFEKTIQQINSTSDHTVVFETEPYLGSNSLYFAFSKEIASIPDTKLSSDLYNFYNFVSQIDHKRNTLEQINEKYGQQITSVPSVHVASYDIQETSSNYQSMKSGLLKANELAKNIITEIKTNYGFSPPSTGWIFVTHKSFDLTPS